MYGSLYQGQLAHVTHNLSKQQSRTAAVRLAAELELPWMIRISDYQELIQEQGSSIRMNLYIQHLVLSFEPIRSSHSSVTHRLLTNTWDIL